MKKIFVAFVTILMSAMSMQANAQILSNIEGMPPYKLGATVGLNMPCFSGDPYTYSIGFQTGLNLMVDGSEIVKNTFGRVEVKYSMKGAYHEFIVSHGDYIKDWYTTHYLEIPIHAGYAWYIDEDWSLMAEAGPYLALGLFGKAKTERANMGQVSHWEDSFFSSPINANRFDLGMGLQVSAMYLKDYQVHVAYDFGFINMHSSFQQNRNLSVGFTYFFE